MMKIILLFFQQIHSQELAEAQKTQHVLLQELTDLTSILKNTTMGINESIQFQNQVSSHVSLVFSSFYYYLFGSFSFSLFLAINRHSEILQRESTRDRRTEEKDE
jgi:hypothetical protein